MIIIFFTFLRHIFFTFLTTFHGSAVNYLTVPLSKYIEDPIFHRKISVPPFPLSPHQYEHITTCYHIEPCISIYRFQ